MLGKLSVAFLLMTAILIGCVDKGVQPDAVASDFTLQDMSGKTVTLSNYKGKVVLLEFWATWCPPCRESIPGLEKLHKAYKDKGLVILAVSLDQGGWGDVKSFVREYGITFMVLKGTDEVIDKYRVRNIPMLLVLNKEGRISKRYLGFGNDEALETDIKAFL